MAFFHAISAPILFQFLFFIIIKQAMNRMSSQLAKKQKYSNEEINNKDLQEWLSEKFVFRRKSNCNSSSTSTIKRTPYYITPKLHSTSKYSSAKSSSHRYKTSDLSTSSITPQLLKGSVISAIVEGRGIGRGEIGIASLDLKNPVIYLSQFADSQTYMKMISKLNILNPIEIIVPDTSYEKTMSVLIQKITEQLSKINITTVQRKYFNESRGLQVIQLLCAPEYNSVELQIANKYYCLAAVAALIRYLEFVQNIIYTPHSLKVLFKGSEKTMLIDSLTAKKIELITNLHDPKSNENLLGVLQHTKTIGGTRLLRANILQPLSDLDTIVTRLNCLNELIKNDELFLSLQSILGHFLDVEYILSLIIQIPKQENIQAAEQRLTTVIYLKHVLELVNPLKTALSKSVNQVFVNFSKTLCEPSFENLLKKIQSVIHDDIRYQKGTLNTLTQKCFAVKPNINGLLDVARRAYTETVDDIAELIQQLSKQYKLPLICSYGAIRGFYIQLYCGGKKCLTVNDLPSVFVKVVKLKNYLNFTTEDLIKLNDRIKESLNEIYLMSNIIINQLLKDLKGEISCLYKLADIVSFLDMMVSFAYCSTVFEWVMPEFTDKLIIKNGRHPILEKSSIYPVIPNDTFLSKDNNFIIITGPNMSGKSTYLKQVALLQIMAQLGCFVPAEYASFRITDQLFSRIGSNDDMESNLSTFMLEMKEMNYILQNCTENSLIIIDELGRGTSVEEGISICFAICEHLISLKCFTLFTTHFLQLTDLDLLYTNAVNYHFQVEHLIQEEISKVQYTHVLTHGSTKEVHYGLRLAEISSLPPYVIQNAKKLIQTLKHRTENINENSSWEKSIIKFINNIICITKDLSEGTIEKCKALQDYYRNLMPMLNEDQ
ncbi:mutS protein homolog 4-like [Centruroides vittatus]|uniref:mutS protein homolog 4-like n=1 Tax=Centruroides vittatus TaxID=120091 RepID=UPI00350EE314